MDNTNILYGKKWAVCGDSFTNGDFSGGYSETFEDGPFAGKYKTYGYLIAERNQMTVQHLAVGGQALFPIHFPMEFIRLLMRMLITSHCTTESMIHTTDHHQQEVMEKIRQE